MQALQSGSRHVLRLEKGEEVVASIKSYCDTHGIIAGSFNGIGAVEKATLAFFDPVTKQYQPKEVLGSFEVLSLLGNISQKESDTLIHAHITLSGADFAAFGGHLKQAFVSVTVEILIDPVQDDMRRLPDETVGLDLLSLKQM